jgi:hypothetical protein
MKVSRRCTGVVAAFGLVSACALLGLQPGRVVRAQEDPASRALAYLQGQQQADGSIPELGGGYADSELFAIAAAADGFDPNALVATSSGVSVMTYLADNAAAACLDPGACGELIQAVVAAGGDPSSFGGQDLLTLLDASYDTSTGEYGDGEAFTQALAIQGLVAAGEQVPSAAIQFLIDAQDSDGGWDYLDLAGDSSGSDTNSTSTVLMALDAAGDHTDDSSALKWLATQQDSDGGFTYQTGPYSVGSDPDSTALVVQAIVATGGDPFSATWTVGGDTPLGYLEANQNADGGYTFPGNSGPDPFTTSQVPLALERLAFPVAFGDGVGYVPGTTLSPFPSSSAIPTPTASPPSAPPAGVITPSTSPAAAASSPAASQVQAVSAQASPAASTPTPAAIATPEGAVPVIGMPSVASPKGGGGGSLPGWLIYAVVALGVAVVVGGGGLVLAMRR